MSILGRWFGKIYREEVVDENRQNEGQLKTELRHLQQQRLTIEQRGCFSDRELAEKDVELEEIDRRINTVKKQQFHLQTRAKLNP